MSRIAKYIIDEEKNRIEFLDSRWYFHESGEWFPSATTILEAYPKGAGYYDWLKRLGYQADDVRDTAADSGSVVHKLTELYDNGEEVSCINEGGRAYNLSEWAMFERYVDFCERFTPEIIHNELSISSPALKFGGTLDRIMVLDGKKILVDLKTGSSIFNHYWLQLAAYQKLYEEVYKEQLDGFAILWLASKTRTEGRKGDYQGRGYQLVFPDKEPDYYWKLFRATYALWNEEHANEKPRNLIYSLKHKK